MIQRVRKTITWDGLARCERWEYDTYIKNAPIENPHVAVIVSIVNEGIRNRLEEEALAEMRRAVGNFECDVPAPIKCAGCIQTIIDLQKEQDANTK